MPGLLADARALLLPSRCYEGSPRAIVEALAAGVPVIASDIGGLPEHVEDGGNGLLVDPEDVDGWAAAIDRLRDDDLSLELGEGAYRRWQEDFSPEVALRSLEALYREAIELHHRGAVTSPRQLSIIAADLAVRHTTMEFVATLRDCGVEPIVLKGPLLADWLEISRACVRRRRSPRRAGRA